MLQSRNVLENSNQTTYIPLYVVLWALLQTVKEAALTKTLSMIQVMSTFFGFPVSVHYPIWLSYFSMSSSSSGLSLSIKPADNIVLNCIGKKDGVMDSKQGRRLFKQYLGDEYKRKKGTLYTLTLTYVDHYQTSQ